MMPEDIKQSKVHKISVKHGDILEDCYFMEALRSLDYPSLLITLSSLMLIGGLTLFIITGRESDVLLW